MLVLAPWAAKGCIGSAAQEHLLAVLAQAQGLVTVRQHEAEHHLLAIDEVYGAATEIEQKEFMRAFIERIDLYPEKQKNGNWIRNLVFNFPIPVNGQEVTELPLESGTMLETVVLLSKLNAKQHVETD